MLFPDRVGRLVILNGHGLYNAAVAAGGAWPSLATLHAGWYQWLFHLPLAEPILSADPSGFARYLWSIWSPQWEFSAQFAEVAPSFDNPDWIATVMSAYRGADTADSEDGKRQQALGKFPAIAISTLNLQGARDGVDLVVDTRLGQEAFYRGGLIVRVIPDCGHFLHRERPVEVADAIDEFLCDVGRSSR
jgi:pimeloyl-ACP methyl ester carboxylesterase